MFSIVDETGFKHLRGDVSVVYSKGNSRISFLEAATTFLYVFNLSVTMARQGGCKQLQQSDMRIVLIIATMGKERFLPT